MFKKLLKVSKSLRGDATRHCEEASQPTKQSSRQPTLDRHAPATGLAMTVSVLGLLIIAGCGVQSGDFVIKEQTLQPFSVNEETTQYQYSAPWDKNLYDGFYLARQSPIGAGAADVHGAIVPHHLTAGYMPATLFDYLKNQNPSTIVLIGPNHFSRGNSDIITSDLDWKTPFGITKADHKIIQKICDLSPVAIEESVMKEEHSIYSLISFISHSLPNTQIIPLILKNNIKTDEMDELVATLEKELPKDAVIVSSIDFSHYQLAQVSAFHDELSKSVIKNFDFARLNKLEIDSTPSLYVLLKLMEKFGAQKPVFEMYDNPGQTSHYSVWFGDGEKSESKSASILFFGDMMLDRNVAVRIKEHGTDWLFSALAGEENRFFQGMDDIHANLEGPFASQRRYTTKSIAFRFDPVLIPTLKKYNFSIFDLANNHALDMGKAGFQESKDNLTKANLTFYGDGYGMSDDALTIKQVGDFKIAFIGLNDTFSQLPTDKIANLIKQAKKTSDFTIVSIHWGEEYKFLKSNKRQQKLARDMIDAGADAIIGHHPHVVQEMEIYKNKPIFYSLGNFIFDQYFSPETQQGLAIGLVLYGDEHARRSPPGADEVGVYVFPLQSAQSQVKLMSGEPLNSFFMQFTDKSRLDNNNFDNFNIKLGI